MRKRISDWIEQYRCIDLGLSFLRLFTGSMLVLHNIDKIQNYNEQISTFPSMLYINNAAVFIAVTVVEVLLAMMIMAGVFVRMSASIMGSGIILLLIWYGPDYMPSAVAWLGVYLFFIVSGGGFYAMDELLGSMWSEK